MLRFSPALRGNQGACLAGWPNGPSGHSSFAKGRPFSVISGMQLRWFYLPAALLSVVLCSCKNAGGGGGGGGSGAVGPFDSRGNYVEAWADTPSKWRKGGGSGEIADAQPDREAANVPVVPEPVPPPTLAANERPKPVSTTTTRVYKKPDGTTVPAKSKATAGTSSKTSKSKPVLVKPKTTPKKEVASKSKTKPKAKSASYTVKAGDNLNSIAKRHGTTASAVQRANGLKSVNSIIRPGQKLTIPK